MPAIVEGLSSNQACLFLHGFLGGAHDWSPVIQELSSGFYCVAPELVELIDDKLTFNSAARAINALVHRFKLVKPILVGYSLGGRLALYSSSKFPQVFSALAIVSANPGLTNKASRRKRVLADAHLARQLQSSGVEAFVRQWYERPLFASLKNLPNYSEFLEDRLKTSQSFAVNCLLNLSLGRQFPLWNAIRNYRERVLLVSGDLDLEYSQLLADLSKAIPRAVFNRIHAAGHAVHLEKPRELAKLIATLKAN